MFRPLLLPGALAVLLASGVVHRLWTGAWVNSNEPAASAGRLANVPLIIGDWECDGDKEINPREVQEGQLAGYLLRNYVQKDTRKEVTVLLVCGRAGPICNHTPDVCFRGRGFEKEGEKTLFRTEETGDAPPADFFKMDMTKTGPASAQRLRVYWAWKAGGPWRAPKYQRLTFGSSPALYKLYLVYHAEPGEKLPGQDEPDPCVELMRDLLPELDKALAPDS